MRVIRWEVLLTGLRRFSRTITLSLIGAAALSPAAQGQFETRSSTPGESSPSQVAVGDFNGDGKLDIADATNSLQIFLGNGDGTFLQPISYLIGEGVIFVATADLRGNGRLDLIASDLSGLFVLLGNGDGTFQAPVAYTTSCIPNFISTGDFNGDKKLDLLVTYGSGTCGYVTVFLGNGDGTFQPTPINTSLPYAASGTGIGDFNGDSKLDLAIGEQFGNISQVEILLGNGDGTFSTGATYAVGVFPDAVAIADFRGTGKLDLAIACLTGVTTVLLGNGDGTFQNVGNLSTPDADSVVAADFNGDGKPDLAVVTQIVSGGLAGVNLALGNGDGTFQVPVFFPAGTNDRFVAVGDFNRDHKLDLIIPDYRFGNLIVLLNTGVAAFSPITPVNYPFQLIGTTSSKQGVTLTNTGTTALSISSMKAHGPFRESNTCGASLAAGAKCTINVAFTPTVMGNVTGSISIIDSASSQPQVIELTGAGTVVGLSPLTLTFASQKVGTTSPPQKVTVTNHGTTALSVSQIYLSGMDIHDFTEHNNCPASIKVGASCTITVTFTPTKTGRRNSSVTIADDGGGSPQSVVLTGIGD